MEEGPLVGKVSFEVAPDWSEIDRVRQRCADFLASHLSDADTTAALTMVACELVENATKYGAFEREARSTVEITVGLQEVVVEVRNPVASTDDAHLARLDRTIQWIRGYQDPFQVYLERLREVAGQKLTSSESGLGLVRIAYEGQAILDFYVDEKNTLAVSAIYRLP
ncbi:MAG TPA: ATP-binding protein [Thermoleophilia bacterium]|nr:ATP-binding protein [Thermoleophilia bacterium]